MQHGPVWGVQQDRHTSPLRCHMGHVGLACVTGYTMLARHPDSHQGGLGPSPTRRFGWCTYAPSLANPLTKTQCMGVHASDAPPYTPQRLPTGHMALQFQKPGAWPAAGGLVDQHAGATKEGGLVPTALSPPSSSLQEVCRQLGPSDIPQANTATP
jgi:hypothetical protein